MGYLKIFYLQGNSYLACIYINELAIYISFLLLT